MHFSDLHLALPASISFGPNGSQQHFKFPSDPLVVRPFFRCELWAPKCILIALRPTSLGGGLTNALRAGSGSRLNALNEVPRTVSRAIALRARGANNQPAGSSGSIVGASAPVLAVSRAIALRTRYVFLSTASRASRSVAILAPRCGPLDPRGVDGHRGVWLQRSPPSTPRGSRGAAAGGSTWGCRDIVAWMVKLI
jgi:hypothetical protein